MPWITRRNALDCHQALCIGRLVPFIGQVTMKVVNFSDARNNLKQVIDRVVADADVAVIARRDAPDAVLMSCWTPSTAGWRRSIC
jgi:prevent-host-death family protein